MSCVFFISVIVSHFSFSTVFLSNSVFPETPEPRNPVPGPSPQTAQRQSSRPRALPRCARKLTGSLTVVPAVGVGSPRCEIQLALPFSESIFTSNAANFCVVNEFQNASAAVRRGARGQADPEKLAPSRQPRGDGRKISEKYQVFNGSETVSGSSRKKRFSL